jgi:pimeloyl-ACP methyl ester carboxylesterase
MMQNAGWILLFFPVVFSDATISANQANHEVDMMTVDAKDPARSISVPKPDALKMQAEVIGEGLPLVLVGGGLTGWESWKPHADHLSATRAVARLQPLNVQFGLEDRRLPEGYSIEMESTALMTALDDLGWREPLDIVGWSYGALIALDAALDNPERVRTLTLIEPPATWVLPEGERDDPIFDMLAGFDMASDVSEADLEWFLHEAGLIPDGVVPTEMPQWPVWVKHRRSLRIGTIPFTHTNDIQRLREFDRPVMLVTGSETAGYYRRVNDSLADILPRVLKAEMPGLHSAHIVSFDLFIEELTRFQEETGVALPGPSGAVGKAGLSAPHAATLAVSDDGTLISYYKRGEGAPLLVVHGTTADHRSWMGMAQHLNGYAAVYAMDRRGRGASGDAADYDFLREVEDVVAVVENIGQPVYLFGHSFGGLCALEAALKTDQIRGLILYEPPVPTGRAGIPPDVPDRIQAHVDNGDLEAAMTVFVRDVAKIPDDEFEAYRQSPLWKFRLPLARTIMREIAVEHAYRFDAARLARLKIPTLLLVGSESPSVYRDATEILRSALPHSRVVELHGQQHLAHHTAPELLAKELLQFVMD